MPALQTAARVALNWLIAQDQGLNCLWHIPGDGFGEPDEMISARAFRAYLQGLIGPGPMIAINALFFWQYQIQRAPDGRLTGITWDHCHRAWRRELAREQLPHHYREAP